MWTGVVKKGCEQVVDKGILCAIKQKYWGEKKGCNKFCLMGVGCSAISVLPLHAHSVAAADLP